MASRGDVIGVFVLFGIVISVFVFLKISISIQKKITDKARSLSDYFFSQRQAELTKIVEDKKQQTVRELEKKTAELTKSIEEKRQLAADELEKKTVMLRREQHHLDLVREAFEHGFLRGRKWLANFIAEADSAADERRSSYLAKKKHPALKAAEEVALALAERTQFKEQVKFLEYQLKSYKEYFPFLEEYEEIILDEAIPLSASERNTDALENVDPVLLYVPKLEYEKLAPTARNQLALDRYLSRPLSPTAIGRFYERYLGYLYEKEGWKVEYHGIVKGYEDLGRDLVCKRGNQTAIVQAKCWSSAKTIHEKHIFQLFGTTQLYLMDQPQRDIFNTNVSAVFITTTSLSPVAKKAAQWLKIETKEKFSIDKTYPMIKCNINQSSKEKIYHLPFDQQYDRTKIDPALGEIYAASIKEAESKGFRRAFRHLAG